MRERVLLCDHVGGEELAIHARPDVLRDDDVAQLRELHVQREPHAHAREVGSHRQRYRHRFRLRIDPVRRLVVSPEFDHRIMDRPCQLARRRVVWVAELLHVDGIPRQPHAEVLRVGLAASHVVHMAAELGDFRRQA